MHDKDRTRDQEPSLLEEASKQIFKKKSQLGGITNPARQPGNVQHHVTLADVLPRLTPAARESYDDDLIALGYQKDMTWSGHLPKPFVSALASGFIQGES